MIKIMTSSEIHTYESITDDIGDKDDDANDDDKLTR